MNEVTGLFSQNERLVSAFTAYRIDGDDTQKLWTVCLTPDTAEFVSWCGRETIVIPKQQAQMRLLIGKEALDECLSPGEKNWFCQFQVTPYDLDKLCDWLLPDDHVLCLTNYHEGGDYLAHVMI